MLEERITNDMKEAMKKKDALRLSCLRMIIADIKNAVIAKQKDLKDDDIIDILQRQIKQHKDSIESFKKGDRQEMADKEQKELLIIQSYLPQQLGEDEIRNIITDSIAQTGAQGAKDMGKVMAAVMPKIKGRADGKIVNKIVLELLNKNAGQK